MFYSLIFSGEDPCSWKKNYEMGVPESKSAYHFITSPSDFDRVLNHGRLVRILDPPRLLKTTMVTWFICVLSPLPSPPSPSSSPSSSSSPPSSSSSPPPHLIFPNVPSKSETSRLVGKWNAKNPSDAIGVSDRLLAVNGLTELKETLAEDLWLGEAAQRAGPEGTLSYILYTILLFVIPYNVEVFRNLSCITYNVCNKMVYISYETYMCIYNLDLWYLMCNLSYLICNIPYIISHV